MIYIYIIAWLLKMPEQICSGMQGDADYVEIAGGCRFSDSHGCSLHGRNPQIVMLLSRVSFRF